MSDAIAADGPSSAYTESDFKHRRRVHRNYRLRQQIRDLVAAYTNARFLGRNRTVERIAAAHSFKQHDLCIVDILLAKKVVTLVCVPHGTWSWPAKMVRVRMLRAEARAIGHNIVLVPQGIVERQPRMGNAAIIGAAGVRVSVDATSRMAILGHLIEHGDCALSDLASVINHVDPYGAILNMVSLGLLRIDLRRRIMPSSLVGLPDSGEANGE